MLAASAVLLEIVIGSTKPANRLLVMQELSDAADAGDEYARIGKQLLVVSGLSNASGQGSKVARDLDDRSVVPTLQAYRDLIRRMLWHAEASNIEILETVLSEEAERGGTMAVATEVILGVVMTDLREVAAAQVERQAAARSARSSEQNTTSGQKSGCYIATAVYGSYDAPEVWTLRRWRDERLASTLLGRTFIRVYYWLSPGLVSTIGRSGWILRVTRRSLDRFVGHLRVSGYSTDPYVDPLR